MTRINVVPVQELSRQHLIAEYRELPRIFGLVKAATARGQTPETTKIPAAYCLGTGHCLFFYDKIWWLYRRFFELVAEMQARGYNPTYLVPSTYGTDEIHYEWLGDWEVTDEALALNRARIAERNGDTSNTDGSGRSAVDLVQEHRIPTGEQSLRPEDDQA